MRSKSLRFQIVTSFLIVLTLAMLLVSGLWVMFLQRQMVQTELLRLSNLLKSSEMLVGIAQTVPSEILVNRIGDYLKNHNISCAYVNIGEVSYKDVWTEGCGNDRLLDETTFESGKDNDVLVSMAGTVWAVFTYSFETLTVQKQFVFGPNDSIVELSVTSSLVPIYRTLREKCKIGIIYGVVNLLILVGLGFTRMTIMVIKPIERLIHLSGKELEGIETSFAFGQANNEFSQLSLSLNQMMRRIQRDNSRLKDLVASLQKANLQLEKNRDEMVRTEKMVSIGRLSAGLAHEIGNPVGIVQGYLDMLADPGLAEEERRQFAHRADKELQRVSRLIRQLLDMGRQDEVHVEPVAIYPLLDSVLRFISVRLQKANITVIRNDLAKTNDVLADQGQLRQVLLNCLLNSIDAMEHDESDVELKIICECTNLIDHEIGNCIQISIMDSGPGLTDEELSSCFEPFYTTKQTGQGTGLGLYVSHVMVMSAGGRMSMNNGEQGGAVLNILLPVRPKDVQS